MQSKDDYIFKFKNLRLFLGSRRWNWKFRENIFEIRMTNFCYIQVIVFDFSYLPVAAVGT